jgi:hypothetical protein
MLYLCLFKHSICGREEISVNPCPLSTFNGGGRRWFVAVFPIVVSERPHQRRDPPDKSPSRQQIQGKNRPPVSFFAGNRHNGREKISENYRKQNEEKEISQIIHNFIFLISLYEILPHFNPKLHHIMAILPGTAVKNPVFWIL